MAKNLKTAKRMGERIKLALLIQLGTGLRIGEVVRAKRSHIDLESGWWTIPAENSKNKIAHRVPISAWTRKHIDQALAASKGSSWLFPAGRGARGSLHSRSVSSALGANRSEGKTLGVADFTSHDLRRTVASRLAEAGVPIQVISKLLNHTPTSITSRVYDKYTYDTEKREALEAWGVKLAQIVS